MKDELADVFMYAILFANELDMDIIDIINNKIHQNSLKYPVEKAINSNLKYDEL